MSDYPLCLGCPFDDPDFGCLCLLADECRLNRDVTLIDDFKPAFGAPDVLHKEVSS